MKKIILSCMVVMSVILASCSDTVTEKIVVASAQTDCTGVGPMKCLLVKMEGDTDWRFMYENIKGFEYTPGYEYVLEVKKNEREQPAADQATIYYTLVKEISKEQKRSAGIDDILQFTTTPNPTEVNPVLPTE